MNLNEGQFAHEASLQAQYDSTQQDAATVTDEHLEQAIEQLIAKDIEFIADSLFESTWWKEHINNFATKSKAFRKELLDKKRVIDLAQEIAEDEARAKREQDEQDRVEAAFED